MTKKEYFKLIEYKNELLSELKTTLSLAHLDFSLDETEHVESWLVKADKLSQREIDAITVYYGETLIYQVGGKWEYCDDSKQVDYLSPVIIDYVGFDGIPLNPLGLVRTGIRKKKTGLIKSTIEFLLNKPEILKGTKDRIKKA